MLELADSKASFYESTIRNSIKRCLNFSFNVIC